MPDKALYLLFSRNIASMHHQAHTEQQVGTDSTIFLPKTTNGIIPSWVTALLLSMASLDAICEEQIINSKEFSETSPRRGDQRFTQMSAAQTGILFSNKWAAPSAFESARTLSFAGGGVAIGDYNEDGLADVYLSRPFGGGKLFRNLGDFKFEDVTAKVGISRQGQKTIWEAGCSWVDVDNDGDLDLSICAFHGANRLFLNEGGKFRNVAAEAGINFVGASVIMAFADYDLDGDLDGYLLTNRAFSPSNAYDVTSREVASKVFPQLLKDADGNVTGMPEHLKEVFDLRWNQDAEMNMFVRAGQYDRLFRNDGLDAETGIPKFSDVTDEAGLRDNGMGLSATWFDYNDDGYPDLYVANDYFGADRLYQNQGDGTFKDVTEESLPHTPWYSMGSNVSDLNNDGLLDLMGTDMSGTNHFRQKIGMGDMSKNAWFLDSAQPRQYMRNAVYINSGTERFMEAAHMTGMANSDWTWAVKFGDLDNDGWTDTFIANGMTGDLFNSDTLNAQRKDPSLITLKPEQKRDANLAFRNLGNLKFRNIGKEWGLNKESVSFGAALGDLDNDGDQDLVVSQFEGEVLVYCNNTSGESGTHSLRVRLHGTTSNRWGVDAKLRLKSTSGIQARVVTLSRGFYSSDDPVIHFGLGTSDSADSLIIDWPSGIVQRLADLKAGRTYTISEPDNSNAKPFRERRMVDSGSRLFAPATILKAIEHVETEFDDFERQPLLPSKSSQLGPGHAWGDVDGDSDDDLYIGGSKGNPGMLYINESNKFRKDTARMFASDSECEDMGSLFFDADGDGDLDLYVVSGGVECSPGDGVLQDRIYFNDGDGGFEKQGGALPSHPESGSVVCGADYDRDGDIDLFVGGRIIPGRYPETPRSQLLVNNGTGEFAEKASDELGRVGLITSALWSDVNRDGWIDLLLTPEWGAIRVFLNDNGKLVDCPQTGLESLTGWWNSISGADLDGDRDVDYVVGNFGLNTKYHASADHPTLLFYGDIENQGRPRIIEAEYEDGVCYPVRGRSCSSHAMPGLAERFPSFKSFAAASLEEIYQPEKLSDAQRLEATTLSSGVLINLSEKGKAPRFEFRALPRIAQIAPVFGTSIVDANGDGIPDLVLAQNFYGPQRETGRMGGGVSMVLLGDGSGSFSPLWPDQSGVIIAGDATSLSTGEFNGDGRPDLFFGVNNGFQKAYENTGNGEFVCLRLPGDLIPGTLVDVMLSDGTTRTWETFAGGGYLTQSGKFIFVGLGAKDASLKIEELVIRVPGQIPVKKRFANLETTGRICELGTLR